MRKKYDADLVDKGSNDGLSVEEREVQASALAHDFGLLLSAILHTSPESWPERYSATILYIYVGTIPHASKIFIRHHTCKITCNRTLSDIQRKCNRTLSDIIHVKLHVIGFKMAQDGSRWLQEDSRWPERPAKLPTTKGPIWAVMTLRY